MGRNLARKAADPLQAGLKDFDSQYSYTWSSWFNTPEKAISEEKRKSCPVQEGLRDYDGRISYAASPTKEPKIKVLDHGNDAEVVQEGLKDFDSVACYGPLHTSKETKAEVATSEVRDADWGLNDFDAKGSYGPVMHNEPDGKLPDMPDSVADGLQNFDSKAEYGRRRILKNITLSHGYSKTDKSFRYQDDIDTREDLDLLRPSDVRAASGIIKSTGKESDAEKVAKRKQLEEEFQKPQQLETLSDGRLATASRKDSRESPEAKPVNGDHSHIDW